ncbi:uncharacterized protein LOC128724023 [Anopheles nili]|uniref:uncharacterized protein LOC128724023 n=1 Tax=Anopheles nili TaxID=185578 RepID=UPI00237A2FF2|nr:uncharacterized protein LOC128724023 [Anopheles nili]
MKTLYVLAVVLGFVAVTHSAPQLFSGVFSTLSQTVYSLVSQITQLLNNIVASAGSAAQTTLSTVVTNALSLLYGVLNSLASLVTVPQGVLTTVNGLLTTAMNQISLAVADAGSLATQVPILGSVQNILTSTVSKLSALNVPALVPLQSTLTQLANTLGSAVAQASG